MANQKPVAEVKLGRIVATIWGNESEKGTFYNVTFSRLYKAGQEWKRSDSFGRDDLLAVAKAADVAHTRVFELAAEPVEQQEAA